MFLKLSLPLKNTPLILTKRQKIIIASVIMTAGLLSTQLVPVYLTYKFIIGLAILSYFLTLAALWEGISKLKAAVLMILPTLFTLGVASYYFLLPAGWISRFPVAAVYGLIFYILLLSQNIFNIASTRTIPLYRVASTTVFVLTLMTAFLIFNVLYSFELLFIWNGLLVFLLSFPLILQVIWSIEMEGLNALTWVYTLVLSLVLGELGLMLSFWPISHSLAALVLSTGLYVVLGISTHSLRDRLSRGVVWEYIGWGVFIFLVAFLTTSWRG